MRNLFRKLAPWKCTEEVQPLGACELIFRRVEKYIVHHNEFPSIAVLGQDMYNELMEDLVERMQVSAKQVEDQAGSPYKKLVLGVPGGSIDVVVNPNPAVPGNSIRLYGTVGGWSFGPPND